MDIDQLQSILTFVGTSENFSRLQDKEQRAIRPEQIAKMEKDDLVETCLDVFSSLAPDEDEAMNDVKNEE
jgi:hypothetical protein